MAERVPELSSGGGVTAPGVRDVVVRGVETGDVDLALARLRRDMPDADYEWFVQALASDMENEVSKMLREAEARRGVNTAFRSAGRTRVVVPYPLEQEESRALEMSYPEYEFVYRPSESHDHALAAMSRRLDDMDCTADLPPKMKYVDFGGNVMYHVKAGHSDALIVGGVLDEHDRVREVLRRKQLQMLARSDDVGVVTRLMADSILVNDGRYWREGSVQTFDEKMRVGKMVHVYDVPLRELGRMMARTGMEAFVGVVHFSPLMREQDEGLLPAIGARYKIDRERDELSMGFVGSSAKWYRHKWSEFQLYGADQNFEEDGCAFSYKIVKRRGDSVKFRILPADRRLAGLGKLTFRSAYVDYVLVDGFRLTRFGAAGGTGRAAVVPRVYKYPKSTWERMVRFAAVEVAKGTLDYNRLVGAYRSMTAVLRYNGVEVSAARLPSDDVPMFVAHVSAFAVMEYAVLRGFSKAFVDDTLWQRTMDTRSTLGKLMQSVVHAVALSGARVEAYLSSFVTAFFDTHSTPLLHGLVVVRESVKFLSVPADARLDADRPTAVLDDGSGLDDHVDRHGFRDHVSQLRETWLMEQEILQAAAERAEKEEDERLAVQAAGDVVSSGTVVASGVVSSDTWCETTAVAGAGPPAWMPYTPDFCGAGSETYSRLQDAHSPAARVAAVLDGVRAAEEEAAAVDAWFVSVYRQAFSGGTPDKQALYDYRDKWYNPEMWYVHKGRIVHDIDLKELESFKHMSVYSSETRTVGTGVAARSSGIWPVQTLFSEWNENGVACSRERWELPEPITGWVMTNKKTIVYNGQEVQTAMRAAAELEHNYQGGVRWGGPGCGKSHLVVGSSGTADVGCSPLRNSVSDLRADAVARRGLSRRDARVKYRTLDSLLVDIGVHRMDAVRKRYGAVARLWVDECFVTLPGKIYAVAALLGAETVVCLGDDLQVPPGVRATYEPMFQQVKFEHLVRAYYVFRATPEVLATFNPHYSNRLRTLNKGVGTVDVVKSLSGVQLDGKVGVYVMYQADKKVAKRHLPVELQGVVKSTHEGQGGTVDTSVLMDLDPKLRPSAFDLFNNPAYVNVAYSRARTRVVLVKPGGPENLAVKWARRAEDRVLVALGRDLSTIGQSLQM